MRDYCTVTVKSAYGYIFHDYWTESASDATYAMCAAIVRFDPFQKLA